MVNFPRQSWQVLQRILIAGMGATAVCLVSILVVLTVFVVMLASATLPDDNPGTGLLLFLVGLSVGVSAWTLTFGLLLAFLPERSNQDRAGLG